MPNPILSRGKGSGDYGLLPWLCWVSNLDIWIHEWLRCFIGLFRINTADIEILVWFLVPSIPTRIGLSRINTYCCSLVPRPRGSGLGTRLVLLIFQVFNSNIFLHQLSLNDKGMACWIIVWLLKDVACSSHFGTVVDKKGTFLLDVRLQLWFCCVFLFNILRIK